MTHPYRAALTVFGLSSVLSVVAAALIACTDDEPRPPVLTEGASAGATPCERIGGLCATSASACGERRVSAGNSLGCEGEGAICCVTNDGGKVADAALDGVTDGATDGSLPTDAAPDVNDAATTDASVDASADASAD